MILLIRHCTPKVDYSKCDYKEAIRRFKEYGITKDIAVEEIKPLRSHFEGFLKKDKFVMVVSSLPRALITAREMFGERYDIVCDDNFIEFDSKVIYIPFLKFKFKTWLTISRFLWLAGLIRTKKSFFQEQLRAKKCAEFLHEKLKENSVVLVVAHALLNLHIEKYLKIIGYNRISKENNGCFTITKLQ